ncbi:GFA family protein [Sphingobium fuliginis]|uniref:GFA family protein n=1 Tax=Sphingobium fuliginis (strain ATCC 27551) TaxID=336203 RepID=UPI0013041B72
MERSGGCACGALRFIARGDASRVGLCHCLVCQRAHGAPYLAFAVFARAAVALCGPYAAWESSPRLLSATLPYMRISVREPCRR